MCEAGHPIPNRKRREKKRKKKEKKKREKREKKENKHSQEIQTQNSVPSAQNSRLAYLTCVSLSYNIT